MLLDVASRCEGSVNRVLDSALVKVWLPDERSRIDSIKDFPEMRNLCSNNESIRPKE